MQHGYGIEVGAVCYLAMASCITSPMTSIGHLKSNRLRGRMFNCKAMASSSSWLCVDKSVSLGRYWRIRPLILLLPRYYATTAMRIAEVDRHPGLLGDLGVPCHLPALIVGHALA